MPVYSLSGTQVGQLITGSSALVATGNAFSAAELNAASNAFSAAELNRVIQSDLGGSLPSGTGVELDATGLTQAVLSQIGGVPVTTFIEDVAGAATMTLTTNGHPDAIVLQTGSGISFTDAGSSGDSGDTIFGDNLTDSIATTQGSNFVVAGLGMTTLQGGSGADTLWGGGQSWVQGGSGDNQKLVGGLTTTASDTLTAGSGSTTLWAGYGHVTMNAGTGADTFLSGLSGGDSMTLNDTSYVSLRDGSANVTITGGADAGSRDTVSADAGATGDDSITTTAGQNMISVGSGYNTINSGADDSISLVNGGRNTVTASGAGADTISVGATRAFDVIAGDSTQTTQVEYSSNISVYGQVTVGSATIVSFSNGTTLVYTGNVHITPGSSSV